MGVNFFKGQFYSCQGLEASQLNNVTSKHDCLEQGGIWENSRANFDNTLNAMLTLFEMITTEGWMTVMNNGMDSTGIDQQPKENNRVVMGVYFV
jgi:hypothetical protein